MQTFLPYEDFARSAQVLDTQRLGKQIIECQQIIKACLDPEYGWQNHPAVNMWRGYEHVLLQYQRACHVEWKERRGKWHKGWLNTLDYVKATHKPLHARSLQETTSVWPDWLGREDFHASHRSNLLRKDAEHYGQFHWDEPDDLPYVWPSKE